MNKKIESLLYLTGQAIIASDHRQVYFCLMPRGPYTNVVNKPCHGVITGCDNCIFHQSPQNNFTKAKEIIQANHRE